MSQSSNGFDYEITIRGIAERIAFQLGDDAPDDSFSDFDESWIKARIFDTFKWLQGKRPNLFARDISFTVSEGGDSFTVPPECDRLLEIYSITIDNKEYPVNMVKERDIRDARIYEKLRPDCKSVGCLYSIGISEVNENTFLITPSLPPDKPVEIQANCSDLQRFFNDCDLELDCEAAKWVNMVVEYVLAQAHCRDEDSPMSAALADKHFGNFFELAPIRRQENTQ